jgi:hypothetical protein
MGRIITVVEGHGEVDSVPVLIRRLLSRYYPTGTWEVPTPIRISRGKLLSSDTELTRVLSLAIAKAGDAGGVLFLFDSDDECAVALATNLLNKLHLGGRPQPVACVVAQREYEAWLIAGAESLRGKRRLPENLSPPDDPQKIRGAKEWLGNRMSDGKYREALDQPALTAYLDIELARGRAPSLDKFCREVERIAEALGGARVDQPLAE